MRYFVFALLLVGPTTLLSGEQQVPDQALCSVCALKGGETELEKVRAHTEQDGKAYYFCSENCKKEFESDPLAYLPPVLPRPAPAFVVENLDGESVSLKDFKGRMVLVDFWATWCKPCLETMPNVQKLYSTYSDKSFEVLGVSIDEGEDRVEKIKKMVDKMNISYPIFLDAKQMPAWHQFKVKAIPAMFLIDGEGQIIAQWVGKINYEEVKKEVVNQVNKSAELESR
jgi:peroxiredoxin/YHS domain-containing protein